MVSKKKKSNKVKKRQKSKKEKRMEILGISILGFFLMSLWLTCISYFISGNFFGHSNYYGQPVGTLVIFAILIIATPVFIIMVWRAYKGTETKKDNKETPYWMKEPPFKWPWQ